MNHINTERAGLRAAILASLFMLLIAFQGWAQTYNGINEFTERGGMPNFYSKVNNGETVRVAYIGGSITQQEGYRVQTFAWFQDTYPSATFEHVVGAIGGTNSKFGVFRLRQDILVYEPDLVFVEFAVNDLGRPEADIKESMEGIVRQTWNLDPSIDIVFVYTARCSMLENYKSGGLPSPVRAMESVADYYNIPSVHMGLIPAQMEAEGRLICSGSLPTNPMAEPIVYTKDGVHPHEETGHVLYTQAVVRAMEQMDDVTEPATHTFPGTSMTQDRYETATTALIDDSMVSGLWHNITDTMASIIKNYTCTADLHTYRGYMNTSRITAKFTGTIIGIYCVAGPTAGRIEVSIDGGAPKTYYTFEKYSVVHRPYQVIFDENLSPGDHQVEILVNTEPFDKRSIIIASRQDRYDADPEAFDYFYLNAVGLMVNGTVSTSTVYIDPDAVYDGNGTQDQPFNTWESVVWEEGGSYLQKRGTTWNGSIILQAGGTSDSSLHIGAYGTGEDPIIASSGEAALQLDGFGNVEVAGLFITADGGAGISAVNTHDLVLHDLAITGVTGDAVALRNVAGVTLSQCELTTSGGDLVNLQEVTGYRLTSCIFHDAGGNALDITGGSGTILYNRFSGGDETLVRLNGSSEVLFNLFSNHTGSATLSLSGDPAKIYNNTFYETDTALVFRSGAHSVLNNLIAGGDLGIFLSAGSLPATCDYNLFFGLSNDIGYVDGATETFFTLSEWQDETGWSFDENSVRTDPLFRDADQGDFGLRSGSGAIDRAMVLDPVYAFALNVSSTWPADVKQVNQNDYGSAWEIGAFAFIPVYYTLDVDEENGFVFPYEGTFGEGAFVTLTAVPDVGYAFTGWTGDLSGTENPVSLVMDGHKQITAQFQFLGTEPVVYEMEYGFGHRDPLVIENSHPGYSGTGAVNVDNRQGSWTSVIVYTNAGLHEMKMRYALGGDMDRPVKVLVNGIEQIDSLNFVLSERDGVDGWQRWDYQNIILDLAGAGDTLTFVGITDESCPNLDRLDVFQDRILEDTVKIPVETSYYHDRSDGTSTGNNVAGYTGTGYIVADMQEPSWLKQIVFTPVSGVYELGIRYRNISGVQQKAARSVNDLWLSDSLSFAVANGSDWSYLTWEQPLPQGYDTLRFMFGPASGEVLVDRIDLLPGAIPGDLLALEIISEQGTVNINSGFYAPGTVLEIIATPDEGFSFSGWSGDITIDANPLSLTLEKNLSLTANYERLVQLTTHTEHGRIEPADAKVILGTMIQLTAIPDEGYTFASWGGDVPLVDIFLNPLELLIDSDKNVIANFYLTSSQEVVEPKEAYRIYPNPCSSVLFLEMPATEDDLEVRILNQLGQQVYQKTMQENKGIVNVEHMPPGVYHLGIYRKSERVIYATWVKSNW